MNNNKIIKRIIYIGTDNNNYVKLNKEFELLSNLIKKDDIYHKKEKKEEKEKKEKKEKKEEKENKYKSTGIKVNIMNNKKIMKRIIYIGTDNNNYVKLNKEFELLSNLIKKDDIYYI